MIRTLLHVTDGYGSHKYYIDGKRVRRDVWNRAYDSAERTFGSQTQRRNGCWYHYTQAQGK